MGDDAQNSTSDLYSNIWNAIEVEKIFASKGIKMTPPSKDGSNFEKFETWDSVTFLKCNYVEDEDFPNHYHACMNLSNPVGELTNWVREGLSSEDALLSNCNDALRFYAAYGEDMFNEFKHKIDPLLLDAGLPPTELEYEECYEDWLKDHELY